jgi:hypothetical protein
MKILIKIDGPTNINGYWGTKSPDTVPVAI